MSLLSLLSGLFRAEEWVAKYAAPERQCFAARGPGPGAFGFLEQLAGRLPALNSGNRRYHDLCADESALPAPGSGGTARGIAW